MRDDMVAEVEALTQRKVVAFMSDNHIDPDMAVESSCWSRSRSRSACHCPSERGRVHAPVVLELEEQAVAARRRERRWRSDRGRPRPARVHVEVGEVALAQRDRWPPAPR